MPLEALHLPEGPLIHGEIHTKTFPLQYVAAEVPITQGKTSQAFRKLAQYYGVLGTPQNKEGQRVPMTRPVLFTGREKMMFVLPHNIPFESVPVPIDPLIQIKEVHATSSVYAAFEFPWLNWMFSGDWSGVKKAAAKHIEQLGGLATPTAKQDWLFAVYHMPSFPSPTGKTSEILIPINIQNQTMPKCPQCGLLVSNSTQKPLPLGR
jgi:hypothetical protein